MPKGAKGRGRGRPKGSKNVVKKVTGKGAYKKNVKNQMSLRRAPIVETKQRVASDIAHMNGFLPGSNSVGNVAQPLNWRSLVTDDAFTLVPINSFYRQQRGLEEHNILGSSLFSKFLNMKLQFQFPEGKDITLFSTQVNNNGQDPIGTPYSVPNRMIQESTKLYLICGWITQNWNCPLEREVMSNGLPHEGQRPQRDQATQGDLQRYISNQLRPYFDDSFDKLQFRPKETTNIKIDKYVRIKPDLDHAIGTKAVPMIQGANDDGPTAEYAHGSIPQVNKSHSWKTNRKVYYTQGQNTTFASDNQNLYPNDSWLPFCVIYNPDFLNQVQYNIPNQDAKYAGRFSQVQMMRYRFNDAHYYTDS
jgi:hypothetical protein